MSAAIALRSDFTGPDLRRLARRTEDARQARRLLALAEIYDGGSRRDAARVGDVGLQIIRDWVLRFNAEGPDGLIDRKAPGPEPRLTEAHRQALVTMIENGPIPAVHDVVRWRLIDLCQRLWEEFRVSVARQTLGRELRALGYRKLSARPRHHAQAEGAIEHFKKVSGGRGRDRAGEGHRAGRDRNLVRRRGTDRTEEQDHPPLGQTWHTTCRANGPAHRFNLHFRCHLSGAG